MFSLVKVFWAANPGSSADAVNTAIKRKFLQGICPSLRKGIFVFCNDPYLDCVSQEQLLQDCRKAKVHFASSIVEPKSDVIDHKEPPEINAVHQTPQPVLRVRKLASPTAWGVLKSSSGLFVFVLTSPTGLVCYSDKF